MVADQAQGLRDLARQVRSHVDDSAVVLAQKRRRAITVAVLGPTSSAALSAAYSLALAMHRPRRWAVVLNAVSASGVVGPAAAHCVDPDSLPEDGSRRRVLLDGFGNGPLVLSPALHLFRDNPSRLALLQDLDDLARVAFVAIGPDREARALAAGVDQAFEVVGRQQNVSSTAYGEVTAAALERQQVPEGRGLLGLAQRSWTPAPGVAVARAAAAECSSRT